MGERYKTCELHGKPFPHNMVDTEKVNIVRLFVDDKQDIEDKTITLSLFVGNSDNEGIDVCSTCLQEKILNVLAESDNRALWKNVSWHQETLTKKDGSGTYQKNVKTVKTQEEVKAQILAEKKK